MIASLLEEHLQHTTGLFVDQRPEVRLTLPRRAGRRIAGLVIPLMLSCRIYLWYFVPPFPETIGSFTTSGGEEEEGQRRRRRGGGEEEEGKRRRGRGGGEEEEGRGGGEEGKRRRRGGGEEEEGAIVHLIHTKASFYHMTSSHSLTLDIA